MAGIGPATSPLPRECSTTEPQGQVDTAYAAPKVSLNKPAQQAMERETGIEPASLAWKARVLPLNYSRISLSTSARRYAPDSQFGGGDWIRTSVGVSQQIYSLPPLATRAPLRRISNSSRDFGPLQGFEKRVADLNTRPTSLRRRRPPRTAPMLLLMVRGVTFRTMNHLTHAFQVRRARQLAAYGRTAATPTCPPPTQRTTGTELSNSPWTAALAE